MVYTNKEMADMHFCYGLADGSAAGAQRLYRERFPNRQIPDHATFSTIHRRLGENGRFALVTDFPGRRAAASQVNIDAQIIQRLENDPQVSTRRLALEFEVSQSTIWRIISNAGYYPYHLQRVQALCRRLRKAAQFLQLVFKSTTTWQREFRLVHFVYRRSRIYTRRHK